MMPCWRLESVLLVLQILSKVGADQRLDKTAFGNEKHAPVVGDQCDPVADRLHSVLGDNSAFLVCDLENRHYRVHHCDSNDGKFNVFAPRRQTCVAADDDHQWVLMSAPKYGSWRKVGSFCAVNRDCADGMYCTGGVCQCYANYAEVNQMCVRVSSICPASTYYPDAVTGRPKTCSGLEACPPGYVCKPEAGGDQGFCCMAAATEVCGAASAYVVNDRPMHCFDTGSSEFCPAGYTCQFYPLANRRYCCKKENRPPAFEETAIPTSVPSNGRPDPYAAHCPPLTTPHLHDGNPVICDPNDGFSCPSGYHCQKNEKFVLHFCCSGGFFATAAPTTSVYQSLSGGESGRWDINPKGPSLYPRSNICSPSHQPFVLDGKPVLCVANHSSSCPIGYACIMHTPTIHFCCQISPWPETNPLFIDAKPTLPSTSSTDQSSTLEGSSSSAPDNFCGPSSELYLSGGEPLPCETNGTEPCPDGYFCNFHNESGFCCNGTSSSSVVTNFSSDGCPEEMLALYDDAGGIQICNLTILPNEECPAGTVCMYSVADGRHQCCKRRTTPPSPPSLLMKPAKKQGLDNETAGESECPAGLVTYRDSSKNESRICTPNGQDQCPVGFFCQWSERTERFLCCGVRAGCPGSSVAYVNPSSGKVLYCGLDLDPACPAGYGCQRSSNGSYVCCTGGSPSSSQPRLHPSSFAPSQGSSNSISVAPNQSGNSIGPNLQGSSIGSGPQGGSNIPVPPGISSPNSFGSSAAGNKLCPAGLPFAQVGTSGLYVVCSETTQCPPGYECLPSVAGNICCLKAGKVCGSAPESGTTTCLDGSNPRIPLNRYYYDTHSETCTRFSYNGCEGNLNNFESMQECEQFCSSGMCRRGVPLKVGGQAQRCDSANGYQCPIDYACTVPEFGSIHVAKKICCPSAALICNLDAQPGQPCGSNIKVFSTVTRYHYVSSLRGCQPFSYYGCNGNANNFDTVDECMSFCSRIDADHLDSTQPSPVSTITSFIPPSSFQCPVFGQVLHNDPTYHICRPTSLVPCPEGFTCQRAMKDGKTTDTLVCCGPPIGSLQNQICPNGTDVYMNPTAKQPTICNPADAEACPRGYNCVMSTFMRTFYCCATKLQRALIVEPLPSNVPNSLMNMLEDLDPECPAGRKPYLYPRTTKALACVKPTSVCPRNFTCVLSTKRGTYLCCSKTGTDSSYSGGFFNPFAIDPQQSSVHNGRTSWSSAKTPLGAGYWIPISDESQWPQARINEHVMPDHQTWTVGGVQQRPLVAPYSTAGTSETSNPTQEGACNPSEKRQLGQPCCANEQCDHQCADFQGSRLCICPTGHLLDFTTNPPRCSPVCTALRRGVFCLPENPEAREILAQEQRSVRRRAPTSRRSNRRHNGSG